MLVHGVNGAEEKGKKLQKIYNEIYKPLKSAKKFRLIKQIFDS